MSCRFQRWERASWPQTPRRSRDGKRKMGLAARQAFQSPAFASGLPVACRVPFVRNRPFPVIVERNPLGLEPCQTARRSPSDKSRGGHARRGTARTALSRRRSRAWCAWRCRTNRAMSAASSCRQSEVAGLPRLPRGGRNRRRRAARAAGALSKAIRRPPRSARQRNRGHPGCGVIESMPPSTASWHALVEATNGLYKDARQARLGTDKFT